MEWQVSVLQIYWRKISSSNMFREKEKLESKDLKERHAYLIMCHNNFKHLSRLVMALDDKRNDIYSCR